MKHDYTQSFDRVELVPLSSEDAEKMRLLRNRNSRFFFNASVIEKEQQQCWYQKYLNTPGDYMFSVYLKGPGIWVGAVGIYDVDPQNGSAEFGRILIDKQAAQQSGLGVDTTKAACEFAFRELGLQTIHLEVYAQNLPAVTTYLKAGFHEDKRTLDSENREIIYMSIHHNSFKGR